VDLIVVKASRGEGVELDEASVIEGILFVLERAEEMGRPVVVNLSLGGHSGPHDGSTDFEKRLQGLFSRVEGRVLVTAAGNDGGRDIHASGSIDGLKTIPVVVPVYERTDVVPGFLVMDLWYRPGSEVEVELISPDGRTSGSASLGETAQLIDGRRGSVSVSHASPQEAHEGLVEVVLLIQEPVSGPLVSGDYQVLLRGQGSFDAWIVRRGPFKGRFGGSIDVDTRLTVPGTVGAALSVGAYNSRSGWVAQNGREIELDLPVGAPSFFSGTGPTLDGRLKPDFLAPGSIVVSALSNDADPLTNPASIFAGALSAGVDPVVEGGRQASTQGTSMAAAFVAGAAALLLEQDGGRTSEEIADLLRATAVPPALGPETLWDPRAGQGLVMVSRALRLGAGERGGSISPSLSSVGVSRDVLYGRDGGLVCVVARAESGLPTEPGWTPEVEVVTESGQVILGEAAPYGEHAVLIPIGRGTARGRGTVHVSIDGVPLDDAPTVTFATARGEVESGQAGRVRGGQCSMSPSGLPPRPNHWLCMALVLVAARVRTVRG
jgi:subtilisin family serine protease